MAQAEVGDDVFGEDPTVNRLQERVAELLGKEAALFVPSGTMANLIGVRLHCQPGDELICEANSHVFNHEQGGYAQLWGIAARPVAGRFGVLEPEQLAGLIRPDNAHYLRTRLVCLENTHNRGGGRIQPYEIVEAVCRWAREHQLATHLDGARLLNAVVATGIAAARWAAHFDTVGICFSKGLGAPVGSAVAGPRELIARGLRLRKVLGGGMRQAGVLAAAALYALDHNVERLAEDHANARRLADGLRGMAGLRVEPETVETNMVFFKLDPALGTAAQFAAELKREGLLVLADGLQRIRMVTHLEVGAAHVDAAVRIIEQVARRRAGAGIPVTPGR